MFRRTLLSSALALFAIPAFATTYTLDPQHTQVHFSWNHFGFSNPGRGVRHARRHARL